VRRLVITADDLGREPDTDEVVLDLVADGAVTSATLIPVAPGSAATARRARALGLQPRLHATLTSERGLPPWRPLTARSHSEPGDAGPVLDPLPVDPQAVDPANPGPILTELDAQLTWFADQGLTPQAADGHGGVLYGLGGLRGASLLPQALAWCSARGLAFRLPRDLAPLVGRLTGALAGLENSHAKAVALADELGVALPRATVTNSADVAQLGSYEALREDLLARLDALGEGVSEVFLHPSSADAVPEAPVRAWEARLLRDPLWRRGLDRLGFDLVEGWW